VRKGAGRHLLNDAEYVEQLELKDRALAAAAEGVTISDPSLPDNPLIYANEGFERLTGYAVDEVIGRNCRFLQGADTDPETVEVIRKALREGAECTVQILNYRKDGTPFWNRLSITPVRDSSGNVTHHIGIQSDITAQKLAEAALVRANREIENANAQMKRDLETAAKVQRALLPVAAPEIPRIRFAWAFQPSAELAGDLFNVHRLGENLVALYVLDVSGHGVAAALMSGAVSRLLTAIPGRSVVYSKGQDDTHNIASVVEVAQRLNDYFPFDPRTAQYFTLIYGLLDAASGLFRYVSAGHPGPILVPASGSPQTLEIGGPPLGLLSNPSFEELTIKLEAGDRLYLVTDGLIEAENPEGEIFGMTSLVQELRAARGIPLNDSVERVVGGAGKWVGKRDLDDDVTVLAFEMN
jgi:sigma-B regulation protein RsbU (phosphoserine phosphatase)